MKYIRNIGYGCLLLAYILMIAWLLNHFFGAVVTGIFAIVLICSMASVFYEMYHAPLQEDEDPSTKKQ